MDIPVMLCNGAIRQHLEPHRAARCSAKLCICTRYTGTTGISVSRACDLQKRYTKCAYRVPAGEPMSPALVRERQSSHIYYRLTMRLLDRWRDKSPGDRALSVPVHPRFLTFSYAVLANTPALLGMPDPLIIFPLYAILFEFIPFTHL